MKNLRNRTQKKRNNSDELAEEFQVKITTNDIMMMVDELKYLPCRNIQYQIYDYSVRKLDDEKSAFDNFDHFSKRKTIRRTQSPITFSKVTCNVYHDTREFYISVYTYTIGIDNRLWEIVVTVRFVMDCITNIYDQVIQHACEKLIHSYMIENHLDILSKYEMKFQISSYTNLIKNSQYDGYSKIYGNKNYHETCGLKTNTIFFDEEAFVPSGISSTFTTDEENT